MIGHDGRKWYSYEYAECRLQLDAHEGLPYLWITCLETRKEGRGQGHATRLLKTLQRWARRYKVRLALWAGPFNDQPMTREQLEAWYNRLGFIPQANMSQNNLQYCPDLAV